MIAVSIEAVKEIKDVEKEAEKVIAEAQVQADALIRKT